jgi:hypothetical protein
VHIEARAADLTAKSRELVAEHENLELLRSILAAEKHEQLEQAADDDVQARHTQKGDLQQTGDADATAASSAFAAHAIEYLHPTGYRSTRKRTPSSDIPQRSRLRRSCLMSQWSA